MKKRKPWRSYKKKRIKDGHIRHFCTAVLIIEGIILGYQGRLPFPVVEIREGSEIVVYQQPRQSEQQPDFSEIAGSDEQRAREADKERIYGIKIRLKDGVVDFYRREELAKGRDGR